jgi:hypothetical protein
MDSPMPVLGGASPGKPLAAKRKTGEAKPRKKMKARYAANLKDLISAGLLTTPLSLFREYRGTRLEATLHADGRVEFNGTLYDSGSTAADMARSTITGRRMNTNGWVFWQYLGADGKIHLLSEDRERFLAMKSKSPEPK